MLTCASLYLWTKPMNPLRQWLADHTPDERERLATKAGTTVGTLRQLAGGYRTDGKLVVDTALAARLEKASRGALQRTDLSPVCGACEFAKRCGKGSN